MEEGNVVMMQVSRAITLPELRQLVLGKLGAQNSSSLQLFFQPEEGQPTNLRVLESLSDFFDYFSAETNVSVRGVISFVFPPHISALDVSVEGGVNPTRTWAHDHGPP